MKFMPSSLAALLGKLLEESGSRRDRYNPRNVAIVVVNYNTLFYTACLIHSLCRKLRYEEGSLAVYVVDNNSSDQSRRFLEILHEREVVRLVPLPQSLEHGPALHQGMLALARQEEGLPPGERSGTVLVLDSDVIVLRQDLLTDGMAALYSGDTVAMAGQLQYDHLADEGGYPHPSCLMFRRELYEAPSIRPFLPGGAPAEEMVRSVRRSGRTIVDFPFRADEYVLHIGRGTLKMVVEYGITDNPLHEWATTHNEPHYHGNPRGGEIFTRECSRFLDEVKDLEYPYTNYLAALGKDS